MTALMTDDLGRRTSAKPKTIGSVKFECFATGILRYEWISTSHDNRARVWRNYSKQTYSATADRKRLGARFISETTAMRAAAKALLAE